MKKKYIITSFLLLSNLSIAKEKKVVTFISPRSQSTNAARELVGLSNHINIYTENNGYGNFSIIPEVTKTFRAERIAQCLLGDDVVECKNTFTIAGSRVTDRDKNDNWLADYFGLPTDFQSKVRINPEIISFLFDFNFFIGLDRFIPGLYFKAHAPLVYTRWDLKITEAIINKGSNNYDPGYFNAEGVDRDNLLDCFISFINGSKIPQIKNTKFQRLQSAKMNQHSLDTTKLSDIQCALGYNFIDDSLYHFGLLLRGTIPVGNRPHGKYLFEPIVGNGHHGEIGFGISGHALFWERESTAEQAMFHVDINIMHLFSACQYRSFDLVCKPNSRYMLAAKMKPTIDNNLKGDGITPSLQFNNEVTTIANLTTLKVNTHVAAIIDLAAMFTYIKDNFSFNFGYSFWARSCEKIKLGYTTPFDTENWVLKGDSHVYGFMGNNDTPLNAGDPVALSASQSNANVHTGQNFVDNTMSDGKKNPNIDNPTPATAGLSDTRLLFEPGIANTTDNQINTSIQPIILSNKDIDLTSAQNRGISHKIFGHFSCSWKERKFLIPYVGLGAEVEFGRRPGPTPSKERKKCINCALSHWGVWAKAGFSYH